MIVLLPVLLMSVAPLRGCLGFSWPRKANAVVKIGSAEAEGLGNIESLLSEEDATSLRINYEALQSSHKPDCFKKAAKLIHIHCTELGMDEDARVKAAISMTLCEVATAKHHSLPLECRPFSLDDTYTRKDISRKCKANASLARSAQFWSSYSGYLREVPQLCHAFRRWNEIDLARDIYYNATVEKIALIRFVVDREMASVKHSEDWAQRSTVSLFLKLITFPVY
ncbi:hypothetical protein BDZ97DRAFT_1874919 [Flammula alnicola]|nr:hypothetical protein BDZ97DRAFT_1874919 [Flammula alnicola]